MTRARLRVIYGDTDQMGVVYYANYFRYFEYARGEWFRERGGDYRTLEAEGTLLPAVEATCSYKSPAKYDDLLVIETDVTELRRASLVFTYRVRREGDDRLICEGRTIHACINRDGKPTRIPDSVARIFEPVASPELPNRNTNED